MITAYSGLPGAGKTLSMVRDVYRLWFSSGLPVYSNINLRFPYPLSKKQFNVHYKFSLFPLKWDKYWQTQKQQWYYPPILEGKDFLDAFRVVDNAIFVIDEAGTVFDNRSWRTFEKWLMAKFRESRKSNLHIYYTAQDVMDVDIKLRQLTNYLVICKFEKFQKWDLFLRNWCYHSQVIRSDTPATRKEYLNYYETIFPRDFKKIYNFYNTLEHVTLSEFQKIDISLKFKENAFLASEGVASPPQGETSANPLSLDL